MNRFLTWLNSVSFTTKIFVSVFLCCCIGDLYLFYNTIYSLTELNIKRAEETAQVQISLQSTASQLNSAGGYVHCQDFVVWMGKGERTEREIKEHLAKAYEYSKIISPSTYSLRVFLLEDNVKRQGKILEYSNLGYSETVDSPLEDVYCRKDLVGTFLAFRKTKDNHYVLPIVFSLSDRSGRLRGSIEYSLDASQFGDSNFLVDNFFLKRGGAIHGAAYSINADGTFVLFPDSEVCFKKTIDVFARESKNKKIQFMAQEIGERRKGHIELPEGYTYKEPVLLFYGTYPFDEAIGLTKSAWKYIYEVKKKDVYAQIDEVKKQYFVGFSIYLLVIFLLLRLICQGVTRPVRQLASIAKSYGRGDFAPRSPLVQGKNELADLATAFRAMRRNLVSFIAKEKEEAALAQQRKTEFELAQKIQLNALPTIFPLHPAFEVCARIQAAKEVGGDLYDFFFVDKTHFAFLVADVTGKGMPAALFMMTAQAQIRSFILSGIPLGTACEKINAALCRTSQDTVFVTAFVALLDTSTGVIEYVNAGHNPPVIKRKGGVELLESENSIPWAAIEGAPYAVHRVTLNAGESLFLYTDGVTEARNEERAFYGTQRLCSLLAQDFTSKNCVERVFESVKKFAGKAEQSDDITMLYLTYRGQ